MKVLYFDKKFVDLHPYMQKIDKISEQKIKGLRTIKYYSSDSIYNIYLGIFGIFDTSNVKWTYYVCPFVKIRFLFVTEIKITNDILLGNNSTTVENPTISNLAKFGKKFNSIKESSDFINDFKIKWETKSNDSKSVIREDKLKEILKD